MKKLLMSGIRIQKEKRMINIVHEKRGAKNQLHGVRG